MVFLQLMVNISWVSTWRKGDVTAAFLQGAARNVEVFGVLYLEPPNRPLAGVKTGCLLRAESVYGLPDAPRAWLAELTGFFKQWKFKHSRVDPAFLTRHDEENGALCAMIILHVDDIMYAHDGGKKGKEFERALTKQYKFGEWVDVADKKECLYIRDDDCV